MIAENSMLDASKIMEDFGCRPTLAHGEMLLQAYRHSGQRREEIHQQANLPVPSRATLMGVFHLLKWVS